MPALSVRSFAPLMKQHATVERKSSYGSYGEAGYAAGVVYNGALVGEMRAVRRANGDEAISSQSFYMMSAAGFTPEDRITLSTEDVASTESWALQPEILAVERYPVTRGQFATVLRLGMNQRSVS